ncbi:9ce08e0f-959e-497f-989e-71a09d173462 [Sclerotinia trifoliorum]|uniref:9ce08e0f-959e-497f-989e-71a09d173462 n=1 Tax=Sclerotinia trifoliorum TaxID=28548 RepID=A0A8H2VW91_9HELO|nr:9ce08e0f-959e-497f-989e-71a09d173462 [Sclerotinia trifoliorum]
MSLGAIRSAVKNVFLCIASYFIGCLYALLVFIFYLMGKPRPRFGKAYLEKSPPYTLRLNDSALTLPLGSASDPEHRKHTTHSQDQCLLLTKLPVEPRKSIWELCLGGRRLRFSPLGGPGELTQLLCHEEPNQQGSSSHSLPSELPANDNQNMTGAHPGQNPKVFPLVLTCRKIYSEAINCLYSSNDFHISACYLGGLPSLLLPQRFNAIRSMTIDWGFPYGSPIPPGLEGFSHQTWGFWVNSWKILAGMKGLSVLDVKLSSDVFFNSYQWTRLQEEEKTLVLQPIREVTKPKKFRLLLPFSLDLYDSPLTTLPCAISFGKWDRSSGYF